MGNIRNAPAADRLVSRAVRERNGRLRVTIVASQFNHEITNRLVEGARNALQQYGVRPSAISTWWVPGAFELPVAAVSVAARKPDAVIAVGCVLKGQTPQYLAIGEAVANALAQVSIMTKIPVTFGVIVADSMLQARARAARPGERSGRAGGGIACNRGREAALAALATIGVLAKVRRAAS
jgi:6,7-dimethyl-8-ribityllumazine synthase